MARRRRHQQCGHRGSLGGPESPAAYAALL